MLCDIANGVSPTPNSHPDVWDVIAWHLRQRDAGEVTISNVKAHVNWRTLDEGQMRKDAFFNNVVDGEAKKAVAADFSLPPVH